MPVTPPPTRPTFSVVVPAHNAASTLGPCLAGVLGGGLLPDDEVLVVDDGSTDTTAAVAGGLPCPLVRAGPPARGAAAARNLGAARASASDHLVFVDSDVVPPPGWRAALARLLDAPPRPDIVVAFPSDHPPLPDFVSAYKQLFIHHTYRARAPGPLNGLYGAFFCIRRGLFARLGGFDERFRGAAFEDLDLGLRASAAGARILLTDRLCWQHLHRYSPGGCLLNDLQRARGYVRTVLGDPRLLGALTRHGSANNADGHLVASALGSAALLLAGGACLPLTLPVPPLALAALGSAAGAAAALHLCLNRRFLVLLARVGGAEMALKGLAWGPVDHAAMGLGLLVGLAESLLPACR